MRQRAGRKGARKRHSESSVRVKVMEISSWIRSGRSGHGERARRRARTRSKAYLLLLNVNEYRTRDLNKLISMFVGFRYCSSCCRHYAKSMSELSCRRPVVSIWNREQTPAQYTSFMSFATRAHFEHKNNNRHSFITGVGLYS